jgi:hypothetical protein
MERTHCLLPRHQVLLDLSSHLPEVDPTPVETYWFFLEIALYALASKQALFYDRFDLSE